MATNNKSRKFGSYICRVGDFLDIYQKTVYDESNGKKNLKIKSKEEAVKAALEILEGGMTKIKSLKGK